jgi:hypothetical protein
VRAALRQLLHHRIQQCLIGEHLIQPPEHRLNEFPD